MRDDLGWKAASFVLGGSIFSHANRLCPHPHQPVEATPRGADMRSLEPSFEHDEMKLRLHCSLCSQTRTAPLGLDEIGPHQCRLGEATTEAT